MIEQDLNEKASEWWGDLTDDEYREVLIKTGNFRLGGWAHDTGPTREDVIEMYLICTNQPKSGDSDN